ncbi:MAG: TatD family hydrolase [Firmicutes bacterium]|nr:TatD family hydrolase [Bacillota bacterium]
MLFDSHAHLNNEGMTDEEREETVRAIENSQLDYVMDIGFDLTSSKLAVDHAARYPWCYAAVGVHPHDTEGMDDMQLAMIKGLAKKNKVMAIGEIGLDFHYDYSPRDEQREWFRKQIRLANELRMPIVIHSREADQEVMDILKEEGAFSDERKSWFPERPDTTGYVKSDTAAPDARVLLHCFSGSAELGRQYVKLGATLSIAGPVTYKNNRKTTAVVEEIPIDFLLVETDSPYLTPEPYRGRKNMSPYVEHTARKVAEIKGLTFEEVAAATKVNAMRFFGIK